MDIKGVILALQESVGPTNFRIAVTQRKFDIPMKVGSAREAGHPDPKNRAESLQLNSAGLSEAKHVD